jgi:hypothetical protein
MKSEMIHYYEQYLEYLNNTLDKHFIEFDEWFDRHGEMI